MDKVRVNIINMHLHDVSEFLGFYCNTHTEAAIRVSMSSKPSQRAAAMMVAVLSAKLLKRMMTARLMVRNTYKMSIPLEEALALVFIYSNDMPKDLNRKWPGVQFVVGELDQATA